MAARADSQREKTVNRFVLIIVTMIDMFLFWGYISIYLQGNIGIGFMLAVDLSVIFSMIACYTVYFRKTDSAAFKHVSMFCYVLVYVLAVFGAQNNLVHILVLPLTAIYILYYDIKVVLRIAVILGAINVADVFYLVVVLGHMHSGAPLNSTSLFLQVASAVIYLFVLCEITKISNENNTQKNAAIKEEQERSAVLFEEVLRVSLKQNNNNADSIEKQTVMTENIQNMIFEAKRMFDEMLTLAEQSKEAVRDGQESMDSLKQQAEKSKEANEQVADSVISLISNAKAVGEITGQIFAISRQANMLALNESIESAGTGEAGKGFSVVVRELADEAKTLTEGIQNIVTELQANADTAKQTVDNVIASVNTENEMITNVNEQFGNIGNSIGGLHTNVHMLYRKIEESLPGDAGLS